MRTKDFDRNRMCREAVDSMLELLTDPNFGYASFEGIMEHAGYPGSEVPWQMVCDRVQELAPGGILLPVREAFFQQIKKRGGREEIWRHPEKYLTAGNHPTAGWVLSTPEFASLTNTYLTSLSNRATGMVVSSNEKFLTASKVIPDINLHCRITHAEIVQPPIRENWIKPRLGAELSVRQ